MEHPPAGRGWRRAALACTSQFREPVGAGYDALVQGHQQALAQLAGQVAEAARALAAGAGRLPAP